MAWVAVGIAAASAIYGGISSAQKAEQQKKFNEGQAEVNRYSPWTNVRGELHPVTENAMDGAFSGGMQGLAIGQSVKKGMASSPGATDPAGSTQMDTLAQSNSQPFYSGDYQKLRGFNSSGSSYDPRRLQG